MAAHNPDALTTKRGVAAPHLLESVWRYRWLVAAVTMLAGLAAFALSSLQQPIYEAEARLQLTDPGTAGVFEERTTPFTDRDRFVRNEAEAANSPQVLGRAGDLLDEEIADEEIAEQVEARPSADVDVLIIAARAGTPEGAAMLANVVAQAYQDLTGEDVQENAEQAIAELSESKQQLQATVDRVEAALEGEPDNSSLQAERDSAVAQLITLDARANQIAVDAALYGSGVKRFQRATPPDQPSEPQPFRNGGLAGILGLGLSAAFAWWRAEHTQSADGREDAAPVLGAPLLGQVPDFKTSGIEGVDPTRSAPHSNAAEAYQFIVASLEYALQHTRGRSVAITSASSADGKTVTALNLAIAAARQGRRVILVDADERASGLTRLTEVTAVPGLTELADETMPFEGCCSRLPAVGQDLTFIPGGSQPDDAARFFRTSGFRLAMSRMKEEADLVVVDTPPLLAVSDTSAIAGQVDGIVLVVARGTSFTALQEVRERLKFVGTPVLGYIFNRASPRSGYGSAYAYGYGEGDGRGSKTGGGDGNGSAQSLPPVADVAPPGPAEQEASPGPGNWPRGQILRR